MFTVYRATFSRQVKISMYMLQILYIISFSLRKPVSPVGKLKRLDAFILHLNTSKNNSGDTQDSEFPGKDSPVAFVWMIGYIVTTLCIQRNWVDKVFMKMVSKLNGNAMSISE